MCLVSIVFHFGSVNGNIDLTGLRKEFNLQSSMCLHKRPSIQLSFICVNFFAVMIYPFQSSTYLVKYQVYWQLSLQVLLHMIFIFRLAVFYQLSLQSLKTDREVRIWLLFKKSLYNERNKIGEEKELRKDVVINKVQPCILLLTIRAVLQLLSRCSPETS